MSKKGKSSIERENESYTKYYEEIKEAYQNSKDWNKTISEVVWIDELTGCNEYAETDKIKLQDVITYARYSKYFTALEIALREGGTYEDLLQIEPKEYKLPETWGVGLGKNKQEAILWAISFEYLLDEPAGLMLLPSPRVIAKEIKAPYSVIMDAYNITRKYY